MSNFNRFPVSRLAKGAMALAIFAPLLACNGVHGELDDVYEPQVHYERHPIGVTKGELQLTVSANSARLSSYDEDAVRRFAQQAVGANVNQISIRRPVGSLKADALAGRIGQIMLEEGVGHERLVHATYSGKGPISLAFVRYVAETTPCGDWSSNLSDDYSNGPYGNFGCAQQHNLAAMAANPKDLIQPRAQTPPDAGRRVQVLTDYRTPKVTSTPPDESQKAGISDLSSK